jgi:hypothetical protein
MFIVPCVIAIVDEWKPTWCHLLFYFTYYVLNMFRTLIYSSSGVCDCVDELPHRSSCSQFVVCWSFWCGRFLVVFVLQAGAEGSVLILLASCQQNCMMCTMKYSCWWTEELSETCRVGPGRNSFPSWSCSLAVSKPVWHIPLLCVQWKAPDHGQRNCPKHVEFYSKNKFEKLVHLVGFIIRKK